MKLSPQTHLDPLIADVPEWIRHDLVEAANWARDTLTNLEGSGHHIVVTACQHNPGFVRCSFSKPAWASDFTGRPGEDAAEAIVLAVCEYIKGKT